MSEMAVLEKTGWRGVGLVTKWDPRELDKKMAFQRRLMEDHGLEGAQLEAEAKELARLFGCSWDEAESENSLVTAGQALALDLLIGAGGTVYSNANAALGVGDSSTAFALGQTNLQGAVNTTDRVRKAMNATFPSRATNVLTFQSTFATTDANFVWNEWAVFNNVTDASGTMLNRAVTNLGTKTSASAWQLTVTVTLT